MMLAKGWFGLILTLIILSNSKAETDAEIEFKGAKVFYETGSIVSARARVLDTLDNMWVQRFGGMLDFKGSNGDRLNLFFGIGGVFWHAIPEILSENNTKVFLGDAVISKAYASYNLGDVDEPSFKFNLGWVPLKYTRSKNLGEYLFRTGTYPNYVITGKSMTTVNTSGTGILGLQIEHNLGELFSHQLLITRERQSWPLHDVSLTYIAQGNFGFFDMGLGAQVSRLIPVSPSKTTPVKKENQYFMHNGVYMARYESYYQQLLKDVQVNLKENTANYNAAVNAGDAAGAQAYLSLMQVDSAEIDVRDSVWQMVRGFNIHWDTLPSAKPPMEKYSFAGIKPTAFFSMDFKELFGEGIFKNEDMVLYGEGILMGIKDYPIFYEDKMDRLALMLGFNVPTFGLLNILNVEVERLTSKFVNGYKNAREANVPLPDFHYDQTAGYNPNDWEDDNIKWSIFASRELFGGMTIQAQVANDHLRGRGGNRVVSEQSILTEKDHWYYMFKIQTTF